MFRENKFPPVYYNNIIVKKTKTLGLRQKQKGRERERKKSACIIIYVNGKKRYRKGM